MAVRFALVLLRWRIKIRYWVRYWLTLSQCCIGSIWKYIRGLFASVSLFIEWGIPFGTGIAMGQWDEFGLALVAFLFATFALILRAIFWVGIPNKKLITNILKGAWIAGSILFFVLCLVVISTKKGGKPWSQVWDEYASIAHVPTTAVNHIHLPLWYGGKVRSGDTKRRVDLIQFEPNIQCQLNLDTCPSSEVKKRVMEMAEGISQIYQQYRRDKDIARERYVAATSEMEKSSAALFLEARTDAALERYRTVYRTNAKVYRKIMEGRIGPTAHDERKTAFYEIVDSQPQSINGGGGGTTFLSNGQIEWLPEIVGDLRSLAQQLPQVKPLS